MHYHIVWGPLVGNNPSVLNFDNKEEALNKFIEIGKAVEEAEKFEDLPGTATQFELDNDTLVVKIESKQTRICFVYCGHPCENHKKPNEFMVN